MHPMYNLFMFQTNKRITIEVITKIAIYIYVIKNIVLINKKQTNYFNIYFLFISLWFNLFCLRYIEKVLITGSIYKTSGAKRDQNSFHCNS